LAKAYYWHLFLRGGGVVTYVGCLGGI